MFGNILIDKIQLNISEKDLEWAGYTVEDFKRNTRKVLLKYYNKTAFRVYSQRNAVKINLTPTRYIISGSPDIDNNLQMPSEDWFYSLIKELNFNDRKLAFALYVVELHLTKNIITKHHPSKYIDYLFNRKYKRMKATIIQSNTKGRTLSIATPKNNITKKDTTGDRQFIFYEKIQQLKDKRGGWYIDLKEHINPEILPFGTVSNDGRRLYLNNNLHILRVELQYKYSNRLKKLAQFIMKSKLSKNLTFDIFIDEMKKKTLYNTLESYYINELEEYIFYKPSKTTQEKNLSIWKRLLSDLIDNTDTKLMAGLYNDCGLGNKYQSCIKDIQPKMNKELYQELHTKLCTLNRNENLQNSSPLLAVSGSG